VITVTVQFLLQKNVLLAIILTWYVFCRMAPFLMTLDDVTAETAAGFYCWFEPSYFRKYATRNIQIILTTLTLNILYV